MAQKNIDVNEDIWAKLKIEAIKRNKNLREFAGEILSDFVSDIYNEKSSKFPKAIILAANYESRLSPLTDKKPTGMITINGKTLIERLLENFKSSGIGDISIVKGYKKDTIRYPGLKYYYNRAYRETGILGSMFCAEAEMDGEFIVSYSDIWVTPQIIKELLKSTDDIAVVVDTKWLQRYKDRHYHPIEEAEKVAVKGTNVVKIGKLVNPNKTYGEFIGLAKFSKRGAKLLRDTYNQVKKRGDQPFQTSSSLKKAYLTDMIQELIDNGHKVSFISIKSGWAEIDTMQDIEIAKKIIK